MLQPDHDGVQPAAQQHEAGYHEVHDADLLRVD
jgi:hypothetical protein